MSEDTNNYPDFPQPPGNDPATTVEASAPVQGEQAGSDKPKRGRPPSAVTAGRPASTEAKPDANKIVKLLDKNPLGMTLPEMAGGPRQIKRIKTLRPLLAEAIRAGLVMPVSQRAGHTVYRLVKHIANR